MKEIDHGNYLYVSGIEWCFDVAVMDALYCCPHVCVGNPSIPTFLNNYPEEFPAKAPQQPLWAERAQRAHLNMVETMPAFIAVSLAAAGLLAGNAGAIEAVAGFAQLFFFARVLHAVVYILGVPFLRTPVYLVSWFAILAIAAQFLL